MDALLTGLSAVAFSLAAALGAWRSRRLRARAQWLLITVGLAAVAAACVAMMVGDDAGWSPAVPKSLLFVAGVALAAGVATALARSAEPSSLTSEPSPGEEERALRTLADNAPSIILRFDRSMRYVFVNRAIEAKAGLPARAFLGKTPAEVGFPPDQVKLWTEALTDVFDGEAERLLEFAYPGTAGPECYRARVVPEFGPDGAVVSALVIADDVTEHKRTEQELAHSLSLLQATLEATADGILVVDEHGRIASYNRKFVEMWRIPGSLPGHADPEGLLGLITEQLESPATFRSAIDALQPEIAVESHDTLTFKDGRVFEVFIQPQRVATAGVGRVLSFRDVTQRKWAERALQESEASYRALVEHATYGIYRSTVDGRFVSVNPALVRMLGYDSERELLATRLSEDVYRDAAERERLIRKYERADRVDGVEVQWKRKDGTPLLVRLSGRPIRDPTGRLESFEMIVEDVSERRALEAQLRQAQKMEAIGQLTGGIAHDFNNLLTVILTNTDLIERALPAERPELLEDLTDLRRAAQHGSDMVRKLLGFSRRGVLALRPLAIGQVVKDLLPTLRRVLPETIDVRLIARDDGAVVRADDGALEQILFNLATNSRDAMPAGGILRVELKRVTLEAGHRALAGWGVAGPYVRLAFSDTGHGMDDATRERIFDPFFTTKPPGLGTGLGMAMIYGLVKQQDGYIDITSRVGQGTTVDLFFPIVHDQARPAPTPVPALVATEGTETILLVEDEAPIRRSAKRLLEKKGYRVLLAENGEEALATFRRHRDAIDLVISDVVMPRMGGWQLYDALRRESGGVRFLFTSGYTARDLPASTAQREALPFLPKPWDVNELLQKVRELLDATT